MGRFPADRGIRFLLLRFKTKYVMIRQGQKDKEGEGQMKNFIKEFKEFISRGNVMEKRDSVGCCAVRVLYFCIG